ncbi:MAG: triose-phosphate isomerase [Desulfovibrio sp.]|jgi:triosephosphate isomerase|nr:triose-phosphate isomerase [Desulfovibrio sp.]
MQKIIAANWKMYKTRPEARETAADLYRLLIAEPLSDRRVIVFPSFTNIPDVQEAFAGESTVTVGAQNFYPAAEGPFTGEISLDMLLDLGISQVLTGHSERRHLLGETDDFVASKTALALAGGFSVMLCIGETLAEREAGNLAEVLSSQLRTALPELQGDALSRLTVAYEPIWAIGTGKVAGPAEVLAAHAEVRSLVARIVGDAGRGIPILYGGSVKPGNASMLLGLDNVDGLLVGGASLDVQSFLQIIKA